MTNNPRFKIAFHKSGYAPFALWYRQTNWFGIEKWVYVDRFETQEKARKFYEKIKDLPEYLD